MPPDTHGGFEAVRDEFDGNPMFSLFAYARPYWKELSVGTVAAVINRGMNLLPALLIAAALDRVIQAPGQPGGLARLGLVTEEVIPAAATKERLALLYTLVAIGFGAYLLKALGHFGSRYFSRRPPRRSNTIFGRTRTIICNVS